MTLETQVIRLGEDAANLSEHPAIAREHAAGRPFVLAIQNVTRSRTVHYAMRDDAPASGSRAGFLLLYGVMTYLEIEPGARIWVWTTSASGARVAIGEG